MTSNRKPKPNPLWALRWLCPRCGRAHLHARDLPPPERARALAAAIAPATRYECRCAGLWRPEQVGFDWQPENDDAREALR